MTMGGQHGTFIGHMAALLISVHSHWSPGPRLLAESLGRTVQEEEHAGHDVRFGRQMTEELHLMLLGCGMMLALDPTGYDEVSEVQSRRGSSGYPCDVD